MEILLVYATYSGATLHAAEIIQDTLKLQGHEVVIRNVREIDPAEFQKYPFIIFGTNTWFENKEEGNMNGGYYALKPRLNGVNLAGKKIAVYGLGDSHQYNTTFCKSVDHLIDFIKELQGTIVSSLRVDRFYFEKQNNTLKVKDWATQLIPLME
jgi:flavodoxin I